MTSLSFCLKLRAGLIAHADRENKLCRPRWSRKRHGQPRGSSPRRSATITAGAALLFLGMRKLKPAPIGQTFGFLTVLREAPRKVYGKRGEMSRMLECSCICGKRFIVRLTSVTNNLTRSCGCKRGFHARESRKISGFVPQRKYAARSSWRNMLNRCYNTKFHDYSNYGGRGISVCDRWRHSFSNFLSDMGERPEGCSLDRIDNNGNYSPENCRWETRKNQNRNKRTNFILTFRGESACFMDWCERLGVHHNTLHNRLKRAGMSVEEAFTKPIAKKTIQGKRS